MMMKEKKQNVTHTRSLSRFGQKKKLISCQKKNNNKRLGPETN